LAVAKNERPPNGPLWCQGFAAVLDQSARRRQTGDLRQPPARHLQRWQRARRTSSWFQVFAGGRLIGGGPDTSAQGPGVAYPKR